MKKLMLGILVSVLAIGSLYAQTPAQSQDEQAKAVVAVQLAVMGLKDQASDHEKRIAEIEGKLGITLPKDEVKADDGKGCSFCDDCKCDEGKCPTKCPVSPDALDEVNAKRVSRGLKPFIRDDNLTLAALRCAQARAKALCFGHCIDDYAALPPGVTASATGCAAYPASYGWMSCCTWENHTYGGAAYVMGRDGKRYMHLFVRDAGAPIPVAAHSELPMECPATSDRRENPASKDQPWHACKITCDLGRVCVNGRCAQRSAQGSGTPIWSENGKTLIVTNAHVIAESVGEIWVAASKGYSYLASPLDVWYEPNGTDLAVLQINHELDFVPIASDVPQPGETVWYYGFGNGVANPTYHAGTVVETGLVNTLEFTGTAIEGDSGSGVFDSAGQLVGVQRGNELDQLTRAPVGTVAVTVKRVHHFLLRDLLKRLFPKLSAKMAGKSATTPAKPATPPQPAPVPPKKDPVPQKVDFELGVQPVPAPAYYMSQDRRGRVVWYQVSGCSGGNCQRR